MSDNPRGEENTIMLSLVEFSAGPVKVAASQCIVSLQMVQMVLNHLLGHQPETEAVKRVCDKLRYLATTKGFLINPCSGALCDSNATLLLLYLEEVAASVDEAEFSSSVFSVDTSGTGSICEARVKANHGEEKHHTVHVDCDPFTTIDVAVRKCLKDSSRRASFLRHRLLRQEVESSTGEMYCRVYVTFHYEESWWVTGWYAKNEISAFTKALMDGYRYFAWLNQTKVNLPA